MLPVIKLLEELNAVRRFADPRTFLAYLFQTIRHLPAIVRAGNLSRADTGMQGRPCRFRVGERKWMLLDGAHFGAAREICCRGVYSAIPGFEIADSDVVVDLGANAGVFTTLAAIRGKRVIAVEAQSGFVRIIESNLENNRCRDKVSVALGLIGAGSGLFREGSERKKASHWGDEAPPLSLCEIIERYELEQIDFLKVDIEGSEFDLLSDAAGWLSRVRRLAMEVHLQYGDLLDIVRTLKTAGFEVWLIDNDKRGLPFLTGRNGYLFAMATSRGEAAIHERAGREAGTEARP